MRQSYTIVDFYKPYMEFIGEQHPIDYPTFRAILEDYFKYIRDHIIENGNTFRMPYQLGKLNVRKYKPKNWKFPYITLDYKATREIGKPVFHINEHSDGYKYAFYWEKLTSLTLKHRYKYHLLMARANKRRLAQIIKNRERDYIEKEIS